MLDFEIELRGDVSEVFLAEGLRTFGSAAEYVRQLPYRRVAQAGDFLLVMKERCGTCSSKHALLAELARENQNPIHLTLGFYEMSERNTPGVGPTLEKYGLKNILEAHCYLSWDGKRFDYTRAKTADLPLDILAEEEITPTQIGNYKIQKHRGALKNWLTDRKIPLSVEQAWQIREECIAALAYEGAGAARLENGRP